MFKLLETLVEKNKKYGNDGQLASYIPALLEANPNDLGVAIVDVEGRKYYAGPVSYTHLTLPTKYNSCRSRWSPYH